MPPTPREAAMVEFDSLMDDLSDEAVARLDETCCRFEGDLQAGRRPRPGRPRRWP